MFEFLENLLNSIDPMVAYVALFFSAFLENVIPPVPGDTVVVIGAYLVSTDKLGFWGVFISTCMGSSFGFMVMYLIGAKFGRTFFFKRTRAKFFKESQINRVEKWFADWGYWVIVANRFLSGTRSVVSVFAGLFHLKAIYVFGLGLVSTMIWNGILILLGLLLGENWNVLIEYISEYNFIFIILTVAIIIIIFTIRQLKKKKKDRGE